jgi:hypothetical protein
MKRNLVALLVCLLFVSVGVMYAQDKMVKDEKKMAKEKETTISGEVVDVACYMHRGAKGEEHKGCAEACAKGGGSLGILTDDGKLYVTLFPDDHAAGPNAMLMDHISHKVKATGMVRSKGGVAGIMITKVEMAKMDEEKKDEMKKD